MCKWCRPSICQRAEVKREEDEAFMYKYLSNVCVSENNPPHTHTHNNNNNNNNNNNIFIKKKIKK
jgi:hypothetical protein